MKLNARDAPLTNEVGPLGHAVKSLSFFILITIYLPILR